MRTGGTCLIMFLLLIACGNPSVSQQPTSASLPEHGLSLTVRIGGSQRGPGLPPIAVQLNVREASGRGAPVVGGTLIVRDSAGDVLSAAEIPSSADGHASVELAWQRDAVSGHRLDIRVDALDSRGNAYVVEQTLAL
jgi:hypothetical protein